MRQGAPATEPMPNPWAPATNNSSTNNNTTTAPSSANSNRNSDFVQTMLNQLSSSPELVSNAFQVGLYVVIVIQWELNRIFVNV